MKNTFMIFQKGAQFAVLAALLSACTATHPPQTYLPDRSGIQAGETITVGRDENIYTIAHEHNVSMRELIVLNNLRPPFEVRPGQSIILPAGGSSFQGNMPPPAAAPLAPVEQNALAPIEPAAVSAPQSLEPIALPPAAPAPTTTNLTTQGLLVPSPQPTTAPTGATAKPMASAVPSAPASVGPVQALNRPSPVQAQTATTMSPPSAATPVAPVMADAPINMVWPVQGPIISGFGSKGAGLTNDGVTIGAPKGAPVVAAAPGTVVYAGDEMKGFGNLVLIRHQNDWVTAYAHLDRVLVKKDSVVAQGDMIGTVGKTGNVATPQLHFETRQNGKAVDPAGVIKNSP